MSTSFWCSNVFNVNSEHHSHHFLVFLSLNLYRKMFIGTACSDYDTISMYYIINFHKIFFQTIKRCCQVHVQAISFLKRNKHWNTFRVRLYREQLGSLRGVSHSLRCCWYVKSFLFLFCVYMIKGGGTLTQVLPFEAKWEEQK